MTRCAGRSRSRPSVTQPTWTAPFPAVRTARALYRHMAKYAKKGGRFEVASNPEFLREGSALETSMRPDRVVIGAESKEAEAILRKIHEPLFLNETPMIVTSLETAELIKYASNCFLATKISFINEIGNLCEALGADVQMVAKGLGMDRRIGPKFLHAGPGYGGSCFPKDTHALSAFAKQAEVTSGLVDAGRAANDHQVKSMGEAMIKGFTANLPLPRGGTVEEAAEAYLYLMRATYVTGQVVRVDGGGSLV